MRSRKQGALLPPAAGSTARAAVVLILLCAFCAPFSPPGLLMAAEVSGRVRLLQKERAGAPVILVFAERLGPAAPAPAGRSFVMAQKNKAFVPRILAVPTGSRIEFPNQDLIFHNVFSLSPPAPFDLGLYRAGAARSRTFSAPGIYRVFCNIHPEMSAVILVLSTDYITRLSAQGTYRLEVPPGRYHLTAWSERAEPAGTDIEVAGSAVTVPDLVVDESNFQERPHKNKFGQEYPSGPYDPLRGHRGRTH